VKITLIYKNRATKTIKKEHFNKVVLLSYFTSGRLFRWYGNLHEQVNRGLVLIKAQIRTFLYRSLVWESLLIWLDCWRQSPLAEELFSPISSTSNFMIKMLWRSQEVGTCEQIIRVGFLIRPVCFHKKFYRFKSRGKM